MDPTFSEPNTCPLPEDAWLTTIDDILCSLPRLQKPGTLLELRRILKG